MGGGFMNELLISEFNNSLFNVEREIFKLGIDVISGLSDGMGMKNCVKFREYIDNGGYKHRECST